MKYARADTAPGGRTRDGLSGLEISGDDLVHPVFPSGIDEPVVQGSILKGLALLQQQAQWFRPPLFFQGLPWTFAGALPFQGLNQLIGGRVKDLQGSVGTDRCQALAVRAKCETDHTASMTSQDRVKLACGCIPDLNGVIAACRSQPMAVGLKATL
jgi:hypothetical protein